MIMNSIYFLFRKKLLIPEHALKATVAVVRNVTDHVSLAALYQALHGFSEKI